MSNFWKLKAVIRREAGRHHINASYQYIFINTQFVSISQKDLLTADSIRRHNFNYFCTMLKLKMSFDFKLNYHSLTLIP